MRFFFTALVLGHSFAFPAHHILPANLELVGVFVISRLVTRVVDAYHPTANLCAAEVVHGQVGASLVLILEPAEALGFAGFVVAGELQKYWLAELGEDGNDVAFGEFVRESAKVHKGRVAVVGVPGCIGGAARLQSAGCY